MKFPLLERWTRRTSILGVGLESNRVVASLARREGESVRIAQTVTVEGGASAVAEDPESVGRALAARLAAADIREKHCAVALPPSWALTVQTEVAAVADSDLSDYLAIRAEREFPLPVADLHLAHSIYQPADSSKRATIAAVQSKRIQAVIKMLASAGLEAVSISIGVNDCLEEAGDRDSLHFLTNGNHLDMVVCSGGGVVLLRTLPAPAPGDAGAADSNGGEMFRDIRITLGRLPEGIRGQLREGRVSGPDPSVKEFSRTMGAPLQRLGVTRLIPGEWQRPYRDDSAIDAGSAAAASAAYRRLAGRAVAFEFVKPRTSPWRVWLGGFASGSKRRNVAAGAAAIALLVVILAWRSHQEGVLERQWNSMRDRVAELEAAQGKIRQFRDWFSGSTRSLEILTAIASAFPEAGDVWAKKVEVIANREVTCGGFARNQAALMAVQDRLRALPEVGELQTTQLRGEAPVQFSFTFNWEAGRDE